MAEPQTKQETQRQPEPKQQNAQGLTRIPVTKIWVREQLDLPGETVMERIDCLPQAAPGRRFRRAHFVPAHQVIEIECYQNEKAEPVLRRLPLSFVKDFE